MKTCRILFITLIAATASCSQKKEPVKLAEAPVYVGVIDNVYPRHGYVLVRLNNAPPPEGTVLISQSPEDSAQSRIANLVVSAERLGNLRVPADIRSGTAEKGDLVFLYKNLAPPQQQSDITEPEETMDPASVETVPAPPKDQAPPQQVEDDGMDTPSPSEQSLDDLLKNIPATLKEAEEQDAGGKAAPLPN